MRILNQTLYIAVICAAMFCSCSKMESFAPQMDRAAAEEGKIGVRGFGTDKNAEVASEVVPRRLVKEGSVSFQTDSIAGTTPKVRQLIDQHKGFVSRENAYNYTGNRNFTLVARIPVDSFDKFIAELEHIAGSFDSRSIEIKDITAQFVDTEARLKAKKEVEKNYLAILEKTKTIDEALAVQKLLGEIRGEIESVEGQLKLMQDRTAFSTLTISYYEQKESVFSFVKNIGKAFKDGWLGFLQVLIAAAYAWVFIVIVVTFLVFRKMRKNRKK
ncbi:MAG TPA: DUF4349 domain-containing protein [bacterium]|nr:DUF4349 domain-containing protein [bacterium]